MSQVSLCHARLQGSLNTITNGIILLSRKFISKHIVGPCGRKFRGTCEIPMGRRTDVEVSCVFSSGDNSTSKAQTPA